LVLKPLNEGSSIDVVICNDTLEVATARERLHVNRNTLLAETFIQGREITVGIIDGNPLPIVEIIPSKEVRTYDYEAKYERNDTQFILKPELPPNDCVDSALLLYQTMHIQDIARVDFIIDNSKSWLLELNTMPGFTDHSLVPMAANSAGVDMVDLCSSLVELAALRVIK
jgi:D-alanine-D-alanine ligase